MAITTAIPDSFRTDLLDGTAVDFGGTPNTFKAALYTSSATLGYGTTVYATTNEASGTGYTAGGNALSGTALALDTTNHVAYVDWDDEAWTSSTITARGTLIYDTTISNAACYVGDFGADKSSSSGTFTLQFPAAAYNTAVMRLA